MSAAATATDSRPRFLFVNEAAAEIRRSEAAVRWLIHTGQLKAGKVGGRVVILSEEIDRFIAAGFEEAS